jgi:hypothetical protein
MSEYVGRIAIGAFMAVAVAVGVGFELSHYVPANVTSTSFAVGPTSTSVSTTTSSTAVSASCGGPVFTVLNPSQNGSLYLKVITDQGSLVNNGSVAVTHTVPAGNGTSGGIANYCLHFEANGTGYLKLSANDGLLPVGAYNLTLWAGYNQGPGYVATIPPFTVQPNATVYVTVSIPSGEVYVVTSTQGSSLTTTTTTSATSIMNAKA